MKNIKIVIIILVSLIVIFGLTSYAYKLNANDVTYDKKTTALESNNVGGAIDELGVLATTSMSELKTMVNNNTNLINALSEKIDSIDIKVDNVQPSSSQLKRVNMAIGLTSENPHTIDCRAIPNYENLTANNFVFDQVKVVTTTAGADGKTLQIESYDANTGTLTISQARGASNGHMVSYNVVAVYLE